MVFDFDIEYLKRNTIPHDALSWLQSKVEQRESISDEDKFLHWIETDILPLNQLTLEIHY